MKYVIYAAVAFLIIWSVWYMIRHLRRQAHGDCGCCHGDCGSCHGGCSGGKKEGESI
ncbi:MAG: hypothetical protein RSC82_05290 [Oscillospiraceae bacterium]